MRTKLEARLAELKNEYQKGQERLAVLEQEKMSVQQSVLRISGAIQVLEELLQSTDSKEPVPLNESHH